MRVLIVDILRPAATAPQRGSFVRDQVAALRRAGVDADHASFPAGKRNYAFAIRRLRAMVKADTYDLVHAHYGLMGWFAFLAGARPLVVTFHGTDVRHPLVGWLSRRLAPRLDLCATASRALFGPEGCRPGLPVRSGASAVLPCGADLERFSARPREEARRRLGLDPRGRYLLFPAAPGRAVKRYDRAAEVARLSDARLLTVGNVDPSAMPDWINAAGAALVPSDHEGFGLAALEALACGVPVLSTPVGIAPHLLDGVPGCLCAPFDATAWSHLVRQHLAQPNPRVSAGTRVRRFSARRMAERALIAYRSVLEDDQESSSPRPTA